MVDDALGAKWWIMLRVRHGRECSGSEMVNDARGAIMDNALGAEWSEGEMVGRALGAKWYVVFQASLTITHTAKVPLNLGH